MLRLWSKQTNGYGKIYKKWSQSSAQFKSINENVNRSNKIDMMQIFEVADFLRGFLFCEEFIHD